MKAFIVIEDGPIFSGNWHGGEAKAGEIVFNTSHNGYEEIATDPSYYGQIMVMCAPQQGNYGVGNEFWESKNMWIQGFVCLEVTPEDQGAESWSSRLQNAGIPVVDGVDTRELVLYLRDQGTKIAAVLPAESEAEAREKSLELIDGFKKWDKDWTFQVASKETQTDVGEVADGPKVALIDYGTKTNILRELQSRCSEIRSFSGRASAAEILEYNPDGILLSNGPGSPENVEGAVGTIQELLGKKPMFGICMGHQLMGRALGFKVFKLKFGHRGANHPVKNLKTDKVYVTSQNHGYALDGDSVPAGVEVTHYNLNDQTVSGIESRDQKCFGVQFHPESHPGPRDAENYFDQFVQWMRS